MEEHNPNELGRDAQKTPDPVLSISGLNLDIDGRQILNNVNLDIEQGTILGLAGESGSGKTMTGMTILGLQPANAKVSGQISFQGTDLLALNAHKLNSYRGRHIAMVFQDPTASLHPMIRIGTQLTDHLRHHLKLSKHDAAERAHELLELVQLPDPDATLSRYPHQFSGGQLQRIAIAIAIACSPELIIADEPTTALDVTVQAGIIRLLRDLCDRTSLTLVLITHDLGVMSALADTIAVMKEGQIVELGSRYDVIRHPQNPYTQTLINSLPNQIMKHESADSSRATSTRTSSDVQGGDTKWPEQ